MNREYGIEKWLAWRTEWLRNLRIAKSCEKTQKLLQNELHLPDSQTQQITIFKSMQSSISPVFICIFTFTLSWYGFAFLLWDSLLVQRCMLAQKKKNLDLVYFVLFLLDYKLITWAVCNHFKNRFETTFWRSHMLFRGLEDAKHQIHWEREIIWERASDTMGGPLLL